MGEELIKKSKKKVKGTKGWEMLAKKTKEETDGKNMHKGKTIALFWG